MDGALEVLSHPDDRVVDVAALDHVQQRTVLGGHPPRRGPGRAKLGDAEADLAAERQVQALQAWAPGRTRERAMEAEVGVDDAAPARPCGQLAEHADRV